ncbi:hypothetical protein COB57_05010 [Candidatus Peregrinibacteria bacterium]|nr:MAG: hypothetical protein COB57_05010 [Candidatus Peregrinibacteria bacterium]
MKKTIFLLAGFILFTYSASAAVWGANEYFYQGVGEVITQDCPSMALCGKTSVQGYPICNDSVPEGTACVIAKLTENIQSPNIKLGTSIGQIPGSLAPSAALCGQGTKWNAARSKCALAVPYCTFDSASDGIFDNCRFK